MLFETYLNDILRLLNNMLTDLHFNDGLLSVVIPHFHWKPPSVGL